MHIRFNTSIIRGSKNSRNLFIIFAAVLMSFIGSYTVSAQNPIQNVPRFGVFEKSFVQSGSYSNPYVQVQAQATLNIPGGGTKTVPLFWDGGRNWKMRFSPNKIGTWTWVVGSNDRGLNGQSGSFGCVASNNKGGIRRNSANPYHFEYENGVPLWWFGDTNWSAFASDGAENLNRATVLRYIDIRSQQGFNYIHSSLMTYPARNEGGSIFNSNNITDEALNPAYFREVDARVQYMNSKGITSGIALAWSNSKPLSISWSGFASDTARLRYARYVAARYSAYNVVFIVSGEWDIPSAATTKSTYQRIGTELMNSDPHDRMITIHPDYRTGSVEQFNAERWMSFGDYIQNTSVFHSNILSARDHNKPVINSEYAYYLLDLNEDGVPDQPSSINRDAFRNATYDIVMAGGYFVSGFGNTFLGGRLDPGPFNVDASKNDVAESDLANIRRLFTSTIWWLLRPGDSLLSGPGTHYALAETGEQYLAYARRTSQAVSLSLGGAASRTYVVRMFDPRTGVWTQLPDYSGVGPVRLVPPDSRDWVFYLEKKDGVPAPAPTATPRPTPTPTSIPTPTPPAGVSVVNLPSVKDTFLFENSESSNRSSIILQTKSPGKRTALLQFDLSGIPRRSQIVSARLRLYSDDYEAGFRADTATRVYATLGSWAENVGWSGRPPRSSASEDSIAVTTIRRYYQWDITDLAQEWVDGVQANFGVTVISEGGGELYFNSRENSSNRPVLVVEYIRNN